MSDTPEIHRFRPAPAPSTDIPIGARSVGFYEMNPHSRETWSAPDVTKIFWCTRGSGDIAYGLTVKSLHPGEIAIYLPYTRHDICSHEDWAYWWWTLDGPMVVTLIEGFGLGAGVFPAGDAPVELFRELESALGDFTRRGERIAGALAYQLLSLAATPPKAHGDAMVEEALGLIRQQWRDPRFGVETMAHALHVHRSTLCRRFAGALGVSPLKYLMNHRMQHALEQLKTRDDPVEQVAYACGFSTGNYFARAVRQVTGVTPSQFRNGLATDR